MSDTSEARRCVAGYNQFVKLVRKGKAEKVYLASDADVFFERAVRSELVATPEVGLDVTRSASQLAEFAGVEVPTAVITIPK